MILEENFRSGPVICDAAQHLIENNKARVQKRTVSRSDAKARIKTLDASMTDESEAAHKVLEGNASDSSARAWIFNEIAVLTRGNTAARMITETASR